MAIYKIATEATFPGGTLVSDDAPLPMSSRAATGTLTNRSGTVTAGGTAQALMAANATRKYLLVQNVSDADLWINFTTTAVATQPSIRLSAGDAFIMEGNFVSTEAISIFGATTGKAFVAKEG